MMHIAPVILANMGSPLMWMQVWHLLLGNAIIGTIEATFLILIFKTRPVRTVVLLIAANYVSMICGMLVFGRVERAAPVHGLVPLTLYNYQVWLLGGFIVLLLLTIMIEWPFVAGSFRRGAAGWKRRLGACAAAQAITYCFCIGLPYWLRGELSVASEVAIEHVPTFVPPDLPFRVYYIDPDDGDVYRMRPDGSQCEHVMEASLEHHGKLAVMNDLEEPDAPDDPLWDLIGFDYDWGDQVRFIEDFAPPESAFLTDGRLDVFRVIFNIHDAADLREADDRDWRVRCRDNAGLAAGIRPPDRDSLDLGYTRAEGDIHLSFNTGFGTWKGRNASVLPGDLVIFEFGGQICALDLNQRKLALLCFGYGPVVVRDFSPGALPD